MLPSAETAALAAVTTAAATPATPALPTSASAAGSSFSAEAMELMAARLVALNSLATTSLPTGLATVPVTEMELPTPARKWQFGASYAVGVFNPNVNFSRVGVDPAYDYNPALGANSPALSEAAAVEYRQHLKSGFTQRLALRATRRLTGRWTLNTGLEIGQHDATSSTSGYFVGEQVPDLGQTPSTVSRKTSFRYHTAGIPVELRYANPVKRGWSAYGRMGAVVNALLGVRADVEGIPEASRTYSLLGASNPYRRVSTTVRGGVGAQFRPAAGNWALSVGPTAEIGLLSLNAHPAQGFFDQSRAYSFGLEAGLAFGH